jgi:hypothetical protein
MASFSIFSVSCVMQYALTWRYMFVMLSRSGPHRGGQAEKFAWRGGNRTRDGLLVQWQCSIDGQPINLNKSVSKMALMVFFVTSWQLAFSYSLDTVEQRLIGCHLLILALKWKILRIWKLCLLKLPYSLNCEIWNQLSAKITYITRKFGKK